MQIRALAALSAALALSSGVASANPGDAMRDVVDGTSHRVVQTGRGGLHEGERLGHRGLQTGRAGVHAVTRPFHHHRHHRYRRQG